MIKKSYFNAVSYTRGVVSKIKSGEKANIKRRRERGVYGRPDT